MDPAPNKKVADGFLVLVRVFNLHPSGHHRAASKSVMVSRGGGHRVEVLKCERAVHQLAVVLGCELEENGWKVRVPKVNDGDPTSGEMSPL